MYTCQCDRIRTGQSNGVLLRGGCMLEVYFSRDFSSCDVCSRTTSGTQTCTKDSLLFGTMHCQRAG